MCRILNKVVREGNIWVKFERGEGWAMVSGERASLATWVACAKALKWKHACCVQGSAKAPYDWNWGNDRENSGRRVWRSNGWCVGVWDTEGVCVLYEPVVHEAMVEILAFTPRWDREPLEDFGQRSTTLSDLDYKGIVLPVAEMGCREQCRSSLTSSPKKKWRWLGAWWKWWSWWKAALWILDSFWRWTP